MQTILFMSACYSFLAFLGQIPEDPSKLKMFESRCEQLAIEGCASVHIAFVAYVTYIPPSTMLSIDLNTRALNEDGQE